MTRNPATVKVIRAIVLAVAVIPACSSVPGHESATPSSDPSIADIDASAGRLIDMGRSQFLLCNSCHVIDAAAPPPFGDDLGPHLENIVGRPAASVPGFAYTKALRALDLVWDEATLDRWLQHPQALVPGMCEPFTGMTNPQHRRALIGYLRSPAD